MPSTLPIVFEDIDEALRQAFDLLSRTVKECGSILGSSGSRESMLKLHESMALCFDLEHLIRSPPTKQHIEAFLDVCRRLRPILASTEWPSELEFPLVKHKWPKESQWKDLAIEYARLCLRLRHAKKYYPRDKPKDVTS